MKRELILFFPIFSPLSFNFLPHLKMTFFVKKKIYQKERNFRVRLEIKGEKNQRKKNLLFFYLLSDHLILIFSAVILYAHWVSGNEIK